MKQLQSKANTVHTFKYFGRSEMNTKQKNQNPKKFYCGSHIDWNFSNEATAQLPQMTNGKTSHLLPTAGGNDAARALHKSSVKCGASHFLPQLCSQQQPGRLLKDSSSAWNRSDLGYFR